MVIGLQHMSKRVLKIQCESLDGFEKMNYIIFITLDIEIIDISLCNFIHVRKQVKFKIIFLIWTRGAQVKHAQISLMINMAMIDIDNEIVNVI